MAGQNGLTRASVENGRENSYLRWEDALAAIDEELPPGSVIASDPLTSYSVTAFTRHYTMCTFDQHAPPNDALLEKRMKAARDVLSPFVPIERTTALLADHHATHVIVNDRFPENVRIEYWSMNHEMYPAIRGKFDAHRDAFEPVYDNDGFVVYKWNGMPAARDSVFDTPFVADRLPGAYTTFEKPAGEATLEGFRLRAGGERRTRSRGAGAGQDVSLAGAGETVALELAWSGGGNYPFRNYVVAVRFDHTNPELPLGENLFPRSRAK